MIVEPTTGGVPFDLGAVEVAPTIGITDYSRNVTDDFGVTTVVERGFSRRLSVKLAVPFYSVDSVQRRLADLRATAARWTADARFQSLSVLGFYKDFSLDLPTRTLAYCTLTVEGLAAVDTLTDPGGDPATEGRRSTLRMLRPVVMTDAFLRGSSVPEADYPQWAITSTYQVGARVILASTHRIYESAAANNTGNDPAGANGKWIDIGPTNRWAAFDQALGTATTNSGPITITLPADQVGALALLDVVGVDVRVQAPRGADPAYDRIVPVSAGSMVFDDLPRQAGDLVVTVTGDNVAIGTLLAGDIVGLGVTEASPTAGITDYSRKETDDFGGVTVSPRAFAKRMTAKALVRTDAIDAVFARVAAVRARPVLWIADGEVDALTVYGFFKDFAIEVGQAVSKLSLSITGLSKAPPALKPLTSIVAQGSVDGTVWHLGLQPGDVFMRISNDSGKNFGPAVRVTGRDGTNAFTAYLTNSDHTVPATFDGTVTSYAGVETSFVIGIGGADLSTSGLFALSIVANPQGLAIDISGNHFRVTGGLDAGEDSATVTARLTGSGQFAGIVVDQVFSLSKSKGGRNGEPPAIITLSASALTARYDTTGVLVPGQAITFGARRQNTAARTLFTLRNANGQAVTASYPADQFAAAYGTQFWSAVDADTITLTEAGIVAVIRDHGGATGRVTMIASIEGTGLADAVSVNKVQDGAKGADGTSPYNAILSNESHTLPADAAGNVLSYAGASFTVTVFYGSQDVTGSFALDAVDNPQSLTGPSGGYPTYTITGGFDATEPSASVTYHFVGRGGTPHAGVRLSKTFSLAKSLGGAGGAPAPLVTLTASALTLRAGTDGNFIGGQRIDFNAVRSNLPGTTVFDLRNVDGTVVFGGTAAAYVAASPSHWGSTGPDNLYLLPQGAVDNMNAHGGTAGRFSVTAYVPGYAVTDTVSIQKVQDGAKGADGKNAVNVIADNETFTVPTDPAGNYSAFPVDVSRGHLRVYDGATEVTAQCTFTAQNPFWLGAYIDAAGAYYCDYLGNDTGYSDLIATYKGVAYSARLTASKVKGGPKGTDGINPPLVSVSASPQAIRYDRDNNLSSGPTTFTAVLVNAIGPVAWSSAIGHSVYGTPGVTFSGNTMTLSPERMRDVLAYNEGNFGAATETIIATASGVSDRVTVTKIRDGAKGADSTVPGPAGADGYAVGTDQTNFVIPAFPSGAPKPSWQGGSGTIVLRKGKGIITAGVTYALEGAVNMAGLGLSGATFSFSGITADTGYFTIVATFEGIAYRARVDAKKVYDGSAAFRGSSTGSFDGLFYQTEVTIAAGSTPIPGGSTVVVSGVINYDPPQSGAQTGQFVGRMYLYARNATDGGPKTLLGSTIGSLAYRYNDGTVTEPGPFRTQAGSVSGSFNFQSMPTDKIYEYSMSMIAEVEGVYNEKAEGKVTVEVVS